MTDKDLISEIQSNIDLEMRDCFSRYLSDFPYEFKEILEYQMGWMVDTTVEQLRGKRFRPVVLLLVTHTLGGNWKDALPAALAIELIHNFSLIHDDIQDHSLTRRGRETVWVKWGGAQAINAGDAMLTLAHLSILNLKGRFSENHLVEITEMIQNTCLKLTRGQFIDIASENKTELSRNEYYTMVGGKTGALLGTSFGVGALLSGFSRNDIDKYFHFGDKLGLAYQIQDDWLGIWGEESITGKSVSSDLLGRKKTYPVIMGLATSSEFRDFWQKHQKFTLEDIEILTRYLTGAGIKEKTAGEFQSIYNGMVDDFNSLFGETNNSSELKNLILSLFKRVN